MSSLFCSELLAEAYQRMLLLSEDMPSNEYTPADWSEEKGVVDNLLLQGAKLEPVVYLSNLNLGGRCLQQNK